MTQLRDHRPQRNGLKNPRRRSPIPAVCASLLSAALLVACQHGRSPTQAQTRTEKLTRLLKQERLARRLAELENKVLQLTTAVKEKDRKLKQYANLGKAPVPGQVGKASVPGQGGSSLKTPIPGASPAPVKITPGRAGLRLRILGYHGRQMTIEVYNAGDRAQVFRTKGLYFVPLASGNNRPQRMGAAGPYEIWRFGAWQAAKGPTSVQPGTRMKTRLQVFCLDKGRRWPSNGQAFRLANGRLPQRLTQHIDSGVRRIVRHRSSYRGRPRMKRAVQRHIWRVRDAFVSPLDGE